MKDITLENNVFYRLLKVSYVFTQVIFFIGIVCFGWFFLKPHQTIETEKSYISCPDGAKYFFASLQVSRANYALARDTCNNHLKLDENSDPRAESNLPTIHQVDKTIGSWAAFVKFEVLCLILAFLLLNGIKQSLLYIVYNKPFTFPFSRHRKHT